MRWLILAALVAACSAPPPTCEAPTGVWRDPDGRRYHLTANPDGYEMVALFDTAAPPTGNKDARATRYAPIVFDLRFERGAISGRRAQRLTRGATVCHDHRSVRGLCDRGALTLRYGAGTRCGELGALAPAATLALSP